MALPIAPTPILYGKDAVDLVRYMRESETQRSKPPVPKLNEERIAQAHKKMMERRANAKNDIA